MKKSFEDSKITIYETEDGQTRLQVKIEGETVWLTQDQMAELFEKSKSTINEHIKNIYEEKELVEGQTMRKFGNSEFSTKPTNCYNLDVIISVGYRVKSVHGHTAAEIVVKRADSQKPLMGLTSFKGNYITSQDVKIAKNYLSEKELNQLNLIVSMYLDFAELQATNGRLMKMSDWVEKLDQFLKLSERKLLANAGSISAEQAAQKAEEEFGNYRKERGKNYISDFDKIIKKLGMEERRNEIKI